MNLLRKACLAGALALVPALLPAVGSAATVLSATITDGGTFGLSSPHHHVVRFEDGDVAGGYSFTFTNDTGWASTFGITDATVLQNATFSFADTGVTAAWDSGESFNVAPGTMAAGLRVVTRLAAGASDTLRISYGDPTALDGKREGTGTIDIAIAAVPLPAAGFLLLAGLGALGLRRRRGD
ncbi:VPLPA-CTERM sorting domain-containing protein [Limimaricola pyoseonensis]|uniref:VPLPA-CTERM protein sorting domain-containing protein n=1 Tax=Limimaricola pyoseonensis TaxID=521013 RepID=A0A1G7IXL4_9RHOB|nr:VPLPA-CTERM sorting domain-containing protein [Limimaricola pyoseonensis]SDF17019.1 VPLPA-CTERM protein sorting domain-containing protein [Limimaricola pyoseonensis]